MAGREAFDAVVVGGGAAGCVIGARLAKRSSLSVLLIEAGPDLRVTAPAGLRDGWTIVPTTEIDWGYQSESSGTGNAIPLRRVKALGGTSWVTRYVVRGAPADYDRWAALGNQGWAFDDLLPYLRRLESDLDFPESDWHGNAGPLPVTRYPDLELSEPAAACLAAAESAGFSYVEDHNEPGAVGVGRMPRSSRGGRRVTTADAYLPVGGTPSNLTIRCDTQVGKLAVNGDRVTGVALVDGSVIEAAHVVLCAGTYGTPALLMRSGIGPADHLRSVDVPVAVDLPGVGAELSDHSGADVDCGYQGPGRQSPNLDVLATFHSSIAGTDEPPDLALWFADPRGEPPAFEIDVLLLRPESRGSVQLRSADPREPLRIVLPNRATAGDVERLVEGVGRALEIASAPELRHLCADAPTPALSGEREIREFVRANAYSLPHVIGTCAMMPDAAPGAVVNSAGEVHGVSGVTVADASVIPVAHSGFTHVIAIALAEKLAAHLASVL